ncbi:c-Myc-binding protein homolog [Anopheles albimanus]|uniref:c-Myc-binding protein n=1 Tax=Anopheles albimanus TaxID=7167 RepID=A0A182FKK2_ANOAL|nr:c-Myc-binding protein homolog [Anopheles albimanus]
MSNYKPIDSAKEDFRKYLNRQGVLDAITKVLTKCNSNRPENAIEFLVDNLGDRVKEEETIARLRSALADAQNEIARLNKIINNLKGNQDGQEKEGSDTPETITSEENASPEKVPASDNSGSTPVSSGTDEAVKEEPAVPTKAASESSPKEAEPVDNVKQDQSAEAAAATTTVPAPTPASSSKPADEKA